MPHANRDSSPPRLASRLVRLAATGLSWRETAVGDLAEERSNVAKRRGRFAADAWYWSQAVALSLHAVGRLLAALWRGLAVLLFVGDQPMRTLWQEIHVAARTLARYPLVTGAIVLTLAIGLGTNAAAFSMLDALVFRPFDLNDADRLAVISEWGEREPFPRESVTPANFLDWKRQAASFDRMAAYAFWQVNLAGHDESERVQGSRITADFFPALGQTPALGRFIDEQDLTSDQRVVVLGNGLWKRRFGARPDIVGQTIGIDGEPYQVIGVAAQGFDTPMSAALWGAFKVTPEIRQERQGHYLTVIARLAPGRTLEHAESEMAVIGDRLLKQYPRENEGYSVRVQSFTSGLIDPGLDQILGMIQIGALFVLAIGGANIANLLLARGWDRQREIALRMAIGAGRARVLRLLLVESAVLAAIAVPMSLAFAWGGLNVLRSAMPARIIPFVPGWYKMDIDGRLIVVISAVAALASILFSLFPALQSSRPNLVAALKEGGRTIAGGRSGRLVRGALVVGQIALAIPLLSATALTVGASDQFAHGPQGYDPEGVIALRTVLPDAAYSASEKRRQFATQLIEATSRLPGIQAAATTSAVPSGDTNAIRELILDGRPDEGAGRRPIVPYRVVSARYFETLRLPILSGRAFTAADNEDAPPIGIVSEALAMQLFPGENAIGRRFRIAESEDKRWMTIVGVAGNIIDDWFSRRNSPMLYVAMRQRPSFSVNLIARTEGDPALVSAPLRAALRAVDPAQPPVYLMTMTRLLHERTMGLQMIGAMMGVLGVLALVLASMGLYGLMSYQVSQRRHEFGVRMALGASRGGVVRLTIRRAWWLAVAGVGVGLVPAVLLSGVIRSVMFGVVAPGLPLYVGIVVTVVMIALAASIIPARQASRVDPVVALRAE